MDIQLSWRTSFSRGPVIFCPCCFIYRIELVLVNPLASWTLLWTQSTNLFTAVNGFIPHHRPTEEEEEEARVELDPRPLMKTLSYSGISSCQSGREEWAIYMWRKTSIKRLVVSSVHSQVYGRWSITNDLINWHHDYSHYHSVCGENLKLLAIDWPFEVLESTR